MEDKAMELIKENVTVNQVCCKGSVRTLLDEDIIVPDVKPDILKILQLDATACVTGKTVSDGRATVNGRTSLKILYIPDSEAESIKSILTSFDFTENIDNKNISANMKALVTASVENAEFTLINSRKLRVRVTVCLDYEIVEEKNIEIAVDATEADKAEILKETVTLQNCVGLCESDFTLKDTIEIPLSQSAVNEVLKADARITDTEYKCVTGRVTARGAAVVSVLYTDEENTIRFMEAEIPFTEVFDCPDATDDTSCDIDYCVSDISFNVEEDSDGDRRIIAVQIDVTAQIKAAENAVIDIISDCYEPYMTTELIKETAQLEEIVSRPVVQNTIRETIEPDSGSPAVTGIYGAAVKPVVTNTDIHGDKLLCEGKIETYILYVTDSPEYPVYSVKRDIPFSCALDAEASGDDLMPEIKAEVKHTAYNLNMSGGIEIRCVLSVSANVVRKRDIDLIGDVLSDVTDDGSKRGIVIYFVQPGDTLWEIAKRYAVPQEDIVSFNNLEDAAMLPIGSRLLIPGI